MTRSEQAEVRWIVRRDDAATEADGGRNDQRVDRHGAVGADAAEQMASDPRRPCPGRDDSGDATSKDDIDGFVGCTAPVQLDQDRSRDAHRRIARVNAAHRRPHPLMATRIDLRTCERRDRLAVED